MVLKEKRLSLISGVLGRGKRGAWTLAMSMVQPLRLQFDYGMYRTLNLEDVPHPSDLHAERVREVLTRVPSPGRDTPLEKAIAKCWAEWVDLYRQLDSSLQSTFLLALEMTEYPPYWPVDEEYPELVGLTERIHKAGLRRRVEKDLDLAAGHEILKSNDPGLQDWLCSHLDSKFWVIAEGILPEEQLAAWKAINDQIWDQCVTR